MPVPFETPEQTAHRLDLPIALVRTHSGFHTCVDGKSYRLSCLVTDPDCEDSARYFMQRQGASAVSESPVETGPSLASSLAGAVKPQDRVNRGPRRSTVESVPVGDLL